MNVELPHNYIPIGQEPPVKIQYVSKADLKKLTGEVTE